MRKKSFQIIPAFALMAAGAMLLYFFRLNVPRHIMNAATVLGAAIGVLLIAAGLCFPLLYKGIQKLWTHKIGKGILIGICALAACGAIAFCTTLGIIVHAQQNTAADQNTVIVLGCQIRGSTPSLMLSRRINAAYDYLCKNPDATAILSGGQGADEDLAEGECMYLLLTEKGIDGKRLFVESSSTNTDENIRNSLAIIEKNNLSKEVAVATSDFHQKRAAMIGARYGLQAAALNAPTPAYLVPVYYTREVLAVWKEAVLS